MYEELGQFYQTHCEKGEKHSRVKRYEIVIEFVKKLGLWDKENWNEILTKDFYLRENSKSRPDFSKNIDRFKNEIREFYKNEYAKELLNGYESYNSKQLEKMTHVEVFDIEGEDVSYILFDYKNRNPLNRQAGIIDITNYINKNI